MKAVLIRNNDTRKIAEIRYDTAKYSYDGSMALAHKIDLKIGTRNWTIIKATEFHSIY